MFSKKKKDDLRIMLEGQKFVNIDALLDIRIYNLTFDQIEKLKNEIKEVQLRIDALEATDQVKMYIKELEEIKL